MVSFAAAWIVGELAFQNIVWQVIATAIFIWFGALDNWAGWLGLAIAVVDWVGLVGLGIAGPPGRRRHRCGARRGAQRRPSRSPPNPTPPTWGSWWRLTRAIPLRSRAVQATRNIDYWGDGTARHRLDVYRSRLAPPEKAPVMVYIHGGAWVIGDKREQGKPMMYELVARGWVCVAINYRLSPKATWPDHIVDAKRAVAGSRSTSPRTAATPPSSRSAGARPAATCARCWLSARATPPSSRDSRSVDTSVQACVPFYGVMDLTRSPEGSARFGPGHGRHAREDGHEDEGVRAPRALPRRVPDVPGATPVHPPSSSSTASTTRWCPWRWPGPSSSASAAVSQQAGGLRRVAPGPARVRHPGLPALPGHHLRRGRLPRWSPWRCTPRWDISAAPTRLFRRAIRSGS